MMKDRKGSRRQVSERCDPAADGGRSARWGRPGPDYGPERMISILGNAGISLSSVQNRQLWRYHELLREHNADLNLTRIHGFTGMVQKLYIDSILPGKLMKLPSPLLDIGTGAGMPGIPLKIAFPELEIRLAESRRKRVAFLELVVAELGLKGVKIIGKTISESFQEDVAGVITRAVETLAPTLGRVRGCLSGGGQVIFMKGPKGPEEIEEAVRIWGSEYRLVDNLPYEIPHTPFQRRLIVFQRVRESLAEGKARAMNAYQVRRVESEQNESFRDLKKLLQSRGIRKEGKAVVSGHKQVEETLRDFPHRCLGWITWGDNTPPPELPSSRFVWFQLARPLFQTLDIFGTDSPLLLIEVAPPRVWEPTEELPMGCSLLVPFQDPENVGAVIRSAVAFGVVQTIMLAESAHPFHPKALRASGGAVLHARLFQGPSIHELPTDLPLVSLSAEGSDIADFGFPDRFLLLPGLEGPGLPQPWRGSSVAIPIHHGVESLNAAAATAIALYLWSRGAGRSTP
jgi:16S rRNA (guanine527-N7)-methyltransferase